MSKLGSSDLQAGEHVTDIIAPTWIAQRELVAFVQTMFEHASMGTIVPLFTISKKGGAFVELVQISDGAVIKLARRAVNTGRSSVLPLATFSNVPPIDHANHPHISNYISELEAGLVEGLALSFDLDRNPRVGRAKLERVLGPPTVVVASGGTWLDPETGELEPRLHLHWRLRAPARGGRKLQQLREARGLLAAVVYADPVTRFVSCPLRYPGSWHRKGKPVLCRLLEINDREISLKRLRHICKMPDGLLEDMLEEGSYE